VELRALIKQTFPEFCSSKSPPPAEVVLRQEQPVNENKPPQNNEDLPFCDEDSQEAVLIKKVEPMNGKHQERPKNTLPTKQELLLQLDLLTDGIKKSTEKLLNEKDSETRCELMEKLIQDILRDDDFDSEVSSSLAVVLVSALLDDLSKKILPNNPDDESLEDSIGSPFFVLLRNLSESNEGSPARVILATLLSDFASQVSCVGYSFLYYLKVTKSSDVSPYKEFAKIAAKDLSSCLLNDLKSCQEEDVNMFCFILPDVYRNFESTVLSNPQFLHLTVSCIDSIQLQDLICHILRGDMKMLKKENVVQIINASLEWETFEQTCVWQLINAHNMAIETVLPVLPKLEYLRKSDIRYCLNLFFK
jgi:integrator complex subunit 3